MTSGVWAAPGRVNIIGEHTDYNNGYALPIAVPQVVTCTAVATGDGRARVSSRQHPGESVNAPITGLAEADVSGWARYPLGVVHEYLRRGHAVAGVTLELDGAVPVGAGLSSSAAVECAVAIALRDLFALPVADTDLIDIGRAAENTYVGAATGTLDQSASVLCTAGHALFLDFAKGEHTQIPFDLAAAGLQLLVVDTNTPHQLVDGEYGKRRTECQEAAAALGVRALREVTDVAETDRIGDPVLRRRARHVVAENARVLAVLHTLRGRHDPREIGSILTAGHARCATISKSPHRNSTPRSIRRWRPAPTELAWWVVASAVASSRSPTPSTRGTSPRPSRRGSTPRTSQRPEPSWRYRRPEHVGSRDPALAGFRPLTAWTAIARRRAPGPTPPAQPPLPVESGEVVARHRGVAGVFGCASGDQCAVRGDSGSAAVIVVAPRFGSPDRYTP